MISAMMCRVTTNPISSRASNARSMTRSKPHCVTDSTRAPDRCLRRSMQNIGAVIGFSFCLEVRLICGLLVPAEMHTRAYEPSATRTASVISSFSGWEILSTRPPISFVRSSAATAATIPASNAMLLLLIYTVRISHGHSDTTASTPSNCAETVFATASITGASV